jgi:hypothetical protein
MLTIGLADVKVEKIAGRMVLGYGTVVSYNKD